jgi:hypothetical protein
MKHQCWKKTYYDENPRLIKVTFDYQSSRFISLDFLKRAISCSSSDLYIHFEPGEGLDEFNPGSNDISFYINCRYYIFQPLSNKAIKGV